MPYFQPFVTVGPAGPPGAGSTKLLYLDTAGGAYTGTPIVGTLIENPNTGTQTTITGSLTNTTALVASFTTPVDYIENVRISDGFWLLHLFAFGDKDLTYRWDLSYVDSDGTSNKTLIVSGVGDEHVIPEVQEMTDNSIYIPLTTLPDVTKRLVLDLYVISAGGNRAFTFEFRDNTESHVHTTLPATLGASPTILSGFNLPLNAVDTNPRMFNSSGTMTLDTAFFTFFTPMIDVTVSQFTLSSAGTASASMTYCAIGLYEYDGTTATLVARTASDTTLFNSTFTAYTRSFDTAGGYPSSYDLKANTRYAIALLCVGGTAPTVYLNAAFPPNSLNTLSPRLGGSVTGQATLPLTASSFTSTTTFPWGRLS